jgi:transcriptional regulator with XRE-family HTH domain
MTQKELSKKTGISIVSLAKYERGERLPNYDNLYRISEVLKLDYDEMSDILTSQKRSKK